MNRQSFIYAFKIWFPATLVGGLIIGFLFQLIFPSDGAYLGMLIYALKIGEVTIEVSLPGFLFFWYLTSRLCKKGQKISLKKLYLTLFAIIQLIIWAFVLWPFIPYYIVDTILLTIGIWFYKFPVLDEYQDVT